MKSYYLIFDGREYYKVNAEGFISRQGKHIGMPEREWGPATADWRVWSLVRRNNFGFPMEYIGFNQWDTELPTPEEQRYKNGKAKYRLMDLDHGTRREWGNPVTVQKLTEKES